MLDKQDKGIDAINALLNTGYNYYMFLFGKSTSKWITNTYICECLPEGNAAFDKYVMEYLANNIQKKELPVIKKKLTKKLNKDNTLKNDAIL